MIIVIGAALLALLALFAAIPLTLAAIAACIAKKTTGRD